MDSIDQFFDFVERGKHAPVNLNPRFVSVPIYTRLMPLFVHAVYRGDNFYTHVSAPVQMKSVASGAGSAKIYCATRTEDLGQ